MKIAYVAKFGSGGNNDEDAILHALRELGHEVHPLRERISRSALRLPKCDFVLFHHWSNFRVMDRITSPLAFWYFDLVESGNPELRSRDRTRKAWMAQVTPRVVRGFCTDGDWAEENGLYHLPQGADERVVGRGKAEHQDIDVLWAGCVRGCGSQRQTLLDELKERFKVYAVERGVYGRSMADLVARAKCVVAPDYPVTDRYWSNRVYVMLGFGAFLLHPMCDGLTDQYPSGLAYYSSRRELIMELENYLGCLGPFRRAISENGLRRTVSCNLYRHRCEELVEEMRRVL